MASFYDKLRCAEQQDLPIVAKLKGVFEALDDAELLKALKGKVHRGCQGYPVAALWRSYLAAYVLNTSTVAGLIRALKNSPAICQVCGISPQAIPSEATYSRFVAKLTKHCSFVKAVMDKGVDRLREDLSGFGRIVAVDSSDIPAYSQSRKPSDPDARWSAKTDKHGRKKFWFGYKVHMVADAQYELPIHVEVTPANVSDSRAFVPLLERSRTRPQYVLGDAGYDAADNYRFVAESLCAVPIILTNKRGKNKEGRRPHRRKDRVQALMYRDHPGVERGSPEWNALYAKRTGIERLFSRMKEFRRLGSVHHRGLTKVALHCYLSTVALLAGAASAICGHETVRRVA